MEDVVKQRVQRLVSNTFLRRLGGGVFLFFLVKGLLWLTVPAALAVWAYAT